MMPGNANNNNADAANAADAVNDDEKRQTRTILYKSVQLHQLEKDYQVRVVLLMN